MSQRVQSHVLRYLDIPGFGFIANPDPKDGRDIYVNSRQIPRREGRGQLLRQNEIVEFEIEQHARGPRAMRVTFPMQGNPAIACAQVRRNPGDGQRDPVSPTPNSELRPPN